MNYQHKWKNRERVVLQVQLHPFLLMVLSQWTIAQGFTGMYQCVGYTEIKVSFEAGFVCYHCNDLYYGSKC